MRYIFGLSPVIRACPLIKRIEQIPEFLRGKLAESGLDIFVTPFQKDPTGETMPVAGNEVDPAPQRFDIVVSDRLQQHIPSILPPSQLSHLTGFDGTEGGIELLLFRRVMLIRTHYARVMRCLRPRQEAPPDTSGPNMGGTLRKLQPKGSTVERCRQRPSRPAGHGRTARRRDRILSRAASRVHSPNHGQRSPSMSELWQRRIRPVLQSLRCPAGRRALPSL